MGPGVPSRDVLLYSSFVGNVPLTAGHIYDIVIDGYGGSNGVYSGDVTDAGPPPPGACCIVGACIVVTPERCEFGDGKPVGPRIERSEPPLPTAMDGSRLPLTPPNRLLTQHQGRVILLFGTTAWVFVRVYRSM